MTEIKHNWTKEEILDIYNKPMMELLYEAATVHSDHHTRIQFRFQLCYLLKPEVVLKIVAIVHRQPVIIPILKVTI